ncbi:hypothetical protein BH10CYA1_BH10CYA1_04020 [soil metagenome]
MEDPCKLDRLLLSLYIALLLLTVTAPSIAADLDPEYAGKPLVVLVFDQNCKVWCTKTRPVMAELKQEYSDNVVFGELDSTQSQLPESKKKAKNMGIAEFFADVADYVPVVLVFNSPRKGCKELVGPKTKSDYKLSIEKAMTDSK